MFHTHLSHWLRNFYNDRHGEEVSRRTGVADAEDPHRREALRAGVGHRPVHFQLPAGIRRPRRGGRIPDRQRPGGLRPVRRRADSRNSRGQETLIGTAKRIDSGSTLLRGRHSQSPSLRQVPRAVPVLHERRSHLVPRRSAPA